MNIIIELDGKNKALTRREAKKLCSKMLNSVGSFDLEIDGEEYTIYVSEAKKICKQIHESIYV